MRNRLIGTLLVLMMTTITVYAEDGYRLWMRYDLIKDAEKLRQYKSLITAIKIEGSSPTLLAAQNELRNGLTGLMGIDIVAQSRITDGTILAGTPSTSSFISLLTLKKFNTIGPEGFVITNAVFQNKKIIVIAAKEDAGVLYGIFHFLKLLQTQQDIDNLDIASTPTIKLRILDHWDNLDRTIERGYAGFSLWNWQTLPEDKDPRYVDYARANASIGINGTVLTNVNANALILTPYYLTRVAALADIFRPYHLKVYLTARFSAPMELGGLKTADPLDANVQQWWKDKVKEVYQYIPDFGGFLVKANSEGQPGPQNYGRTHADGANMLANAVQPYGGIVMWRAFVYDNNVPEDRARQAYNEFKPLDGAFKSNVLVQVKNGAIDFQPREPFHPLFGAMPATPMMMEFQLTQEYLGYSTHLVYLATLFKESLSADTYSKGKDSYVAKVVDGSLDSHSLSGIAGVANIGNERNWCGHPFAQANWYAFGRLAWNHELTAAQIANEWIRMTFTNNDNALNTILHMMLASREITVDYMTPLGLHHIMGWNHHYGPGPWVRDKPRADWTAVYYHRADSLGIGFDRTTSGSNAISQYAPPVQQLFSSLDTCPEKYLLWFHHLSWNYKTKSGATLWNSICNHYQNGVDSVRWMQREWNTAQQSIDPEQFQHVKNLLTIQEKEAMWWRNSCLLYFQTFSHQPLPKEVEKPDHTLDYYEKLEFPFAPGIRPKW